MTVISRTSSFPFQNIGICCFFSYNWIHFVRSTLQKFLRWKKVQDFFGWNSFWWIVNRLKKSFHNKLSLETPESSQMKLGCETRTFSPFSTSTTFSIFFEREFARFLVFWNQHTRWAFWDNFDKKSLSANVTYHILSLLTCWHCTHLQHGCCLKSENCYNKLKLSYEL